jgi:hypothetical protein
LSLQAANADECGTTATINAASAPRLRLPSTIHLRQATDMSIAHKTGTTT